LSAFQDYLRKELDASGKADPSTLTKDRQFHNHLTQLAPDWERRRRMGQLRMKTFLRIYISKWFWKGLEWNERELVLELIKRYNSSDLDFIRNDPSVLNKTGVILFVELYDRSMYHDPSDAAEMLDEADNLLKLLFTEQDFLSVWKLRSVQSLRDFIFIRVTGHEHEGKVGIKKRRIRGYRDGKASPKDPKLIKLALEVDKIFYSQEQEDRWRSLEAEINSLVPGH
jgi:hypothetical protein